LSIEYSDTRRQVVLSIKYSDTRWQVVLSIQYPDKRHVVLSTWYSDTGLYGTEYRDDLTSDLNTMIYIL